MLKKFIPSKTTQKATALEDKVIAPNYHPLPVVLSRGKGAWLWDIDGKKYLDMMSAYSAVSHGHGHPRLIKALTDQAQKLCIPSRAFYTDTLAPFLNKLCKLTGLELALPMNTGAEAVETAIKGARRWGYQVKKIPQNKADIIVAGQNFHGRTTTIVSFSSDTEYKKDFGPFTPGFTEVPFGDAAALEAAITPHTCAVLLEPIQGEAGIIVPPKGYLKAVRKICDKHNVLLMLDEIQSGLGRSGKMFAHQHDGIKPDALILGKALGGGVMPVSAVIGRKDMLALFTPGSHGSTFGGNPLAAAVGLEALQVLEDEKLVARSTTLGRLLKDKLAEINSPLIADVRGEGLWVGVEINPQKGNARDIVLALMARGILSKETHETVIRFAPPFVITEDELLWAVAQFEQALSEASA